MSKITLNVQELTSEKKTLSDFLASPDAFSDSNFAKKSRRLAELDELIATGQRQAALQDQIKQAYELSNNGDELAALAKEELPTLEQELEDINERLFIMLTPKDPNDDKDIIMEIRAGAGGDEASLFAGEIYRMYLRWCEAHGYKTDLISDSPNDNGGHKEVIFSIKGDAPYSRLKFEGGVHRVQRIPSTESQGRVHTSTATVAVLPEAEETEVLINANDLRVDVFRSGGNGGQSVNTTDSAVRLTHLPTGIVVTNQDEKSQIKNKEKAMGVLRAKLLQQQVDQENAKLTAERRALVGTGDRSEKIRTYNFPQDRITDHRIHYSRSNMSSALSGEIDDLIDKLQAYERELKAQGAEGSS